MRAPKILLLATLMLFGCGGAVPEEAKDTPRWTAAVVERIEPLSHVTRLQDVKYSLQGTFRHTKAWISGTVFSDAADDKTNLKLLDEVGRAVTTALADNPIKDSWVKVEVVGTSGKGYDFDELGLPATPTLDDLAARYGIPRR